MTVLLLDARWPTMIPMNAHGRLHAPAAFTSEVPISVRWDFDDLLAGADATGLGVLVTTNADDPEVRERIDRGESVIRAASLDDPIQEAQTVMSRAVRLGEWEAAQTHEALLPYLQEEAAEFAEAVRSGHGDAELLTELGDVFLQVLFHAELASRRGAFEFDDVAAAFVAKMRSRAPYLFDGTTRPVAEEEQNRLWAEGKRRERGAGQADH